VACAWEHHLPIALLSTFRSSCIQLLLGNSSTVAAMRKALTKLKPPTPLQAKDGALRRIPRSTAFIALQKALELFQEVAGTTGVPGLQEGVKGLTILLAAIQVRLSRHSFPSSRSQMDPPLQKTSQNSDDMESLAKRIQELHVMLQKASSGGTLSPAMTDRIDRLSQ
jgi:hypothetical protein